MAYAKLNYVMKVKNRLPQKECTRLHRRRENNFDLLSLDSPRIAFVAIWLKVINPFWCVFGVRRHGTQYTK